MIEPNLPGLSVGKQCALLSISRSSFYYEPKGVSELNLALMRQIDRQFLETPFYGVRQMTWHLRNEGHLVNEKRIRRLMRLMGLMPIYQRPNTSKAAKGHKIYPYLLRGIQVTRPNQVWASDITYSADAPRIPLSRSHHGLAHPQGAGLAHLQHSGGRLLRRGAERSDPQVRPARDYEHGPGQPVHVVCLDGPVAAIRRAHLDGWQGSLPRQHLCRTAMAIDEIRMRVPACLGYRITGQRPVSENGWSSTTPSAHTPHLAANRQPWSIGWEMKQSNPISRSEE